MIPFVFIAGLLLVAAIAAILVPLLRSRVSTSFADRSALSIEVLREQLADLDEERRAGTLDGADYAQARAEIERRALEDARPEDTVVAQGRRPWIAALFSVGIIAASIGLYAKLGTPGVLGAAGAEGAQQQNAHAVTPQQIQAMVARLADRLQENPNDGEGWAMLARSYSALGRYPEAAAAYGRAAGALPPDASLLADYADTLAMAQGRRLQGDPERIIAQALAADPSNIKALALAGSASFERQDYSGAIKAWRKILDLVPEDADIAVRIRNSIADAEARRGK
jgi:cytochrome c-type biogenesis protein CcmH